MLQSVHGLNLGGFGEPPLKFQTNTTIRNCVAWTAEQCRPEPRGPRGHRVPPPRPGLGIATGFSLDVLRVHPS